MPLLAALIVVGASARLGVWQLGRAAQKEALQAALDTRGALPAVAQRDLATQADAAAGQHYRRVVLHGRWLAAHTVYLDNRQMNGRPGFVVVTPLVWPGGAVAVQRGWVVRDNDVRSRLPAIATPDGEVEVRGRIAPPPARLYEFRGAAGGPIRQNLDLAAFSREIGVALLPLSVLQDDAALPAVAVTQGRPTLPAAPAMPADGLLRRWPRPAVDVQKHYGYAFQWFAICAVTAGLYVWFQIVQPRRRRVLPPAD
jgi:surfeit locus 1 family protein